MANTYKRRHRQRRQEGAIKRMSRQVEEYKNMVRAHKDNTRLVCEYEQRIAEIERVIFNTKRNMVRRSG